MRRHNVMAEVIRSIVDFLVDIIKKSPSGDSYLSLPQFSKMQLSCDVGYLLEGLQAISRIFDDYLGDDE